MLVMGSVAKGGLRYSGCCGLLPPLLLLVFRPPWLVGTAAAAGGGPLPASLFGCGMLM
jgi:hypothetical protein